MLQSSQVTIRQIVLLPHPLFIAIVITSNTINIIPTTVTFLTIKVIGIATMNKTNENAILLANDENNKNKI
jgi:hypothetical protein